MRIIEPSVELWRQGLLPYYHVARCARVCYGKEGSSAGSAEDNERLCRVLENSGHWSMFRHATYYAVVRWGDAARAGLFGLLEWSLKPLCRTVGIKASFDGDSTYFVAYNGNWALDHANYHKALKPFLVDGEEFARHGAREAACLTAKRNEYGKEVRKAYESGLLKESRHTMQRLEPRTDGVTNTITTVQKDNLIAYPSMRRIRKLTERECFRLMDVDDADIDKIQAAGISKTQQYKMAGNSIVVSCLCHIFRKLFIDGKDENAQLSLF